MVKMGKGMSKVGKVMGEFKRGTLKSSAGPKVTNPKQAVAIGLSEARSAGARLPKKPTAVRTAQKPDKLVQLAGRLKGKKF